MFFKIESWNFQQLFEKKIMKPYKIFNSFSSFRQFLFSIFLLIVWLSWHWGFTKFIFKQMLKMSAFYLEKQKSFIPKKNELSQEWTGFNIKTTSFVYWPNFQRWLWVHRGSFFNYVNQILPIMIIDYLPKYPGWNL